MANSLDRTGYLAVFGLAVAVLVYWGVRRQGQGIAPFASLKKLARRFRRHPLPFCFLVLVVMAFIGGALYEPDNSDTSDYRIPRVWHWLAAGHWHWIHSLDLRLNNAGTGYEWLT